MSLFKIFVIFCFLNGNFATPDEIINQLSKELNVRTQIYFSHTKDNLERLNLKMNKPKFVIYKNTSEELKSQHDQPVIFVTILEKDLDYNLKTAKVVKSYLKDRQFNDVLLLDLFEVQSYLEILRAYWEAGFSHVIIYDSQQKLWTMQPYPHLNVTQTDLKTYLLNRNGYRRNLKGYPLRVLVTNDAPHCFVDERELPGSPDRYKGSIISIFKIFANKLNATFQAVLFPELKRYSTRECVMMVATDEAEACGSIFVRTYTYPTSQPPRINRVVVMAPFGNPIDKFYYFFRPFDLYVWLAIGLLVVHIAAMGSLLHRWRFGHWDVGQYLLLAVQTLLTRGLDLPQLSGGSKLMLLLLLFVTGFILSNLYVALLSMMLTTKLYQRPIDNVADLKAANVSILVDVHHLGPAAMYGSSEELRQLFLMTSESRQQEKREGLDPSYAFVDSEDRMDFFLYQQKFLRRRRMKKLQDPVGYSWAVQVIKQNWVLERAYNDHVQRMFETGLQNKLVEDVHEVAIRAGFLHFFPTQSYTSEPLRLEDIVMAAMVLGCGHALAGICFLGELFA
ncbi:hypothetical protein KR018_002430 [Drosophila ironensis]|nr:hypothetical protein KR018_002430 [Drosophila ironensis]